MQACQVHAHNAWLSVLQHGALSEAPYLLDQESNLQAAHCIPLSVLFFFFSVVLHHRINQEYAIILAVFGVLWLRRDFCVSEYTEYLPTVFPVM